MAGLLDSISDVGSDLWLGAKNSMANTVDRPLETIGDTMVGVAQSPFNLVSDIGNLIGVDTPMSDSVYKGLDSMQSGNSPVAHRIGRDIPEVVVAPLKAVGSMATVARGMRATKEATLGSSAAKNIGWANGTPVKQGPIFENLGNPNVPDNVVDQFFKFNDELRAGENASKVAWDNMQIKANNLIRDGKFSHMKDPRLGVHTTNYPDNLEFIADKTESSHRNFRGTYASKDAAAAREWANQGEYSIPFVYDANTIANMGDKIPSTLLKDVGSKFRNNIKNPTLHDIRNNSVYRQQDINGIPLSLQDMNSDVLSKMGKTGVDVYNGEIILRDNANVKSIIGNTEFNPNTANIFKGLIPGMLGAGAYEGANYGE